MLETFIGKSAKGSDSRSVIPQKSSKFNNEIFNIIEEKNPVYTYALDQSSYNTITSLNKKSEEIVNYFANKKNISFTNERDQEYTINFLMNNSSAFNLFKSIVSTVKSGIPELVEIICVVDDDDEFGLIVHSKTLDGLMDKIESIREGFYYNPDMKYFHLTTDFAIL
ncbi:MAG: hypothetical protein AB9907_05575 [Flexilinea sp.]